MPHGNHTFVFLTAAALAACGHESSLDSVAVILARDRAADHAARGDEWPAARALLLPLVVSADAPLEDLLRAANAELAIVDGQDPIQRALPLLARAERLEPENPVLLWCRYHIAWIQYDLAAALPLARHLRRLRPDDFLLKLALAQTLEALGESEQLSEAETLYRELARIPAESTGAWRVSILYRLGQLLNRQGKPEEAAPLLAEVQLYHARKVEIPKDAFHSPGTLGMVRAHTPGRFDVPRPKPYEPRLERKELRFEGASGALPLHLGWGSELREVGERREEVFSARMLGSVVAWGTSGVALVHGDGAPLAATARSVTALAPFDRMNHGVDRSGDALEDKQRGDRELDLVVLAAADGGASARLLENVGGRWNEWETPLAQLPPVDAASRLLPVDYDHDGDVDWLASTAGGLRLLRNDGLDGSGTLTDATAEAGLPAGRFRIGSEDIDRDDDVDFLLLEGTSGLLRVASNERGGHFSDGQALVPAGLVGQWIVPADFDADGWVDLAVFGQDLALHTRDELGGWRAEAAHLALPESPLGEPQAADWDLDGTFDLLWPCASATAKGLLAPGFANAGVALTLGSLTPPVPGAATLAVADLDGDHDNDLLRLDASGLHALLAAGEESGARRGLTLALQGYKTNARGLGAILELRAGLLYRRIYYRGAPELVGFGGHDLDVAAVTWTNGVWQGDFELPAGTDRILAERPGMPGSCPFLYTWNGTTYEFISDVLGVTPLGLPMAPGMPGSGPQMVPPDHDEYVLVKGEQLAAKDGVFELHFTEELREVTYLDQLRLDVVDHPTGTEVFPNERFSFPPFPEAHTHTVEDPLVPLSAVDQSGKSWQDELARDDRRFALPFETLNGPYRGLATHYTLELAFDPTRVANAEKLRLFLNGWFYWTDASVNLAVARHPDFEFIPPILSVPDENGGWKELGPLGFPAGKLKTMAVDVSALLNKADPRIRLFSTLRLYWDSIRLATDADAAPLVTTALEPSSARLWQRGFSRSFPLLGEHDCEWFEWDALEKEPRWNQHPGLYTKLGETRPLVASRDDQFVVMGAGDALTVRFDAKALPPLPAGWRRDYLVFLDGWAKDRDPNTLEALYVEPLPFHGMSGYPYNAESEHYPDDEAHRAYRREWNTRPARQWIESLVPPRASARPSSSTGSVASRD